MRTRLVLRLVLLTIVTLLAAACGSQPASEPKQALPSTHYGRAAASVIGTIDVQDQSGDGSSVMVSSVELSGAPGWVVIHSDVNGKPGPVLGISQIPEGSSRNLSVRLAKPLTATAIVWPMLHVDDHTVGQYEFGKVENADTPVKSGSNVVMKRITVTVS
jgi:hypothetical protein